ncbi:hypothetical protein B0T14DRAFT_559322 [Immersiella caudata]|uniref:Uncharacterized protein n=1 Tax=Immersiella caudata TaxID=314043 RepID=A0AA39XCP8_9PEZI|nr:hypothetical protein B0T14DRAFT_559322 [Immersiella caudata]
MTAPATLHKHFLADSQHARHRFRDDSPQWSEDSKYDGGTQYTQALPDNEKPKVVCVKSLKRSLVQFLIFHFPPIVVTLGLLSVYVLRISWGVGNDGLGALLFAAKVHETLIIGSLFHILFYHIRRGLLGPDGIPFGFLTAAFQLSSPFYLINSSFLAPLLRYRPVTFSSSVLTTVLVVTFTVAALAGASSGIVMIPRLDWWEIDLHKVNDSLTVGGIGLCLRLDHLQAIVSPVERLYPTTIDPQSYPFDCGESGHALSTPMLGTPTKERRLGLGSARCL